MVPGSNLIGVYLEVGTKRTFAGALDWPGWCRNGRDETAALKAGWRTFDSAVVAAKGKELRKVPRGGVRWTARRFVRRVAWHVLDHAWEIEDRIL